ncbi:MAG: hypothetical protein P4L71_18855 [Acetobacteraceae bacterium]|nr:hypothetical protein [Acetobacteraceae bacterium]
MASDEPIDLAAVLMPTMIDPAALDRVTATLQAASPVPGATWTVSATT